MAYSTAVVALVVMGMTALFLLLFMGLYQASLQILPALKALWRRARPLPAPPKYIELEPVNEPLSLLE